MSSVGAFAQSETNTPLKGDLNEDGKVDAADIVVLVDLVMKNGGEAGGDAIYYWYAGTTLPNASNISSIATGSATNKPNWTADNKQDITVTNNTGETAYMYYCFPSDWNVILYDQNGFEMGLVFVSNFTYNGIEYKVERLGRLQAVGATHTLFARCKIPDYWYAGPDMLTSETIPGSGTVYPMTATDESQIGWHKIEGHQIYIETGDLNFGEKINWVLAIPTELGLTHVSNGEDVTDAYDVSTVTCADGVEYMVFRQIEPSKRTSIYFVDGERTYHLYFGTTLPTSDNIASIADITEDVPPYHLLENGQRWELENSTSESADAYICIPSSCNVIWKDENGNTIDLIDVSTFYIYKHCYHKVQKLKNPLGAGEKKYIYAYNGNEGANYYWYAGTTLPNASNINTIGTNETSKPNWTASNPQSLAVTNNTGESAFIYYCFPTTWNVTIIDGNKTDEMSMATEGTFTYNNVEYTILRQGRKTANGSTKDLWAKCDNDT